VLFIPPSPITSFSHFYCISRFLIHQRQLHRILFTHVYKYINSIQNEKLHFRWMCVCIWIYHLYSSNLPINCDYIPELPFTTTYSRFASTVLLFYYHLMLCMRSLVVRLLIYIEHLSTLWVVVHDQKIEYNLRFVRITSIFYHLYLTLHPSNYNLPPVLIETCQSCCNTG